MNWTEEQKEIIKAVKNPNNKLIKVNSVAGSGKTAVLTGISKTVGPRNGIYLAYNKAIAKEAQSKFPHGITCMTTHSLAYQNTIRPYRLNVGFFNWKSIKERIPYEIKLIIIDVINDFCLSEFTSFSDYIDNDSINKLRLESINKKIIPLSKEYITKMISGEIDITHAGYLKMYHMLLASKKIRHKKFDLIMLDECGDINPVTLEIFKLLPSDKKVMVGDENQNIYTFNKTINGFSVMQNEGMQLNMTRSFRCNPMIAKRIELFSKQFIDPRMEFKGTDAIDDEIRSVAIISRTNSALVGEMIELIKLNISFNLTRKASVVFELVLIMLNLKPGGKIFAKEWKFLQEEIDEWDKDEFLKKEYPTPFKFIANKYGEDPAIKTTLGIIGQYGPPDVYMAYEYAKKHENEKKNMYTLCTAHSSKGLEFDRVDLTEDMNTSIEDVVMNQIQIEDYNDKQLEAMRLYYVACSRATKKLNNAMWLPPLEKEDIEEIARERKSTEKDNLLALL